MIMCSIVSINILMYVNVKAMYLHKHVTNSTERLITCVCCISPSSGRVNNTFVKKIKIKQSQYLCRNIFLTVKGISHDSSEAGAIARR